MRRTLHALLHGLVPGLLLALAVTSSAAPESDEFERPWRGILPDRHQTVFDRERPASVWYACRCLDASTGRPVAGARWIRTPEWIAGWRLRHDAVLSVGLSDADGIAHLPADAGAWRDASHWLVLAPGYAPAYDYATVPRAETLLHRGTPLRGRLLDAMGRGVAGGVVETLGGCSHGTAPARARTADDGSFSFERVTSESASQFWVEGPGIASDLLAVGWSRSLGESTIVLSMDAGVRYEGRIVDLLGDPVPGAVVRASNEQRGPVAATDADGRFVLEGVEGRGSFQVFPPFDLTEEAAPWYVNDAHPGVPVTVVVTPLGVFERPEDARVVLEAKTEDGQPVGGLAYVLVRGDDGRGPSGTTEDDAPSAEEDLPLGSDVVEPAAGAYRVLPSDPFGEHTFEPLSVRAEAGCTTRVQVVARPQPRLRIAGAVPVGARLRLAVPRAQADGGETDASWSPSLPATGDAVLRVLAPDRPPFFFPVGPVVEGVREVVVALPDPKVIVLPYHARDVALLDGTRDVYGAVHWSVFTMFLTDAVGPLTLRCADGDGPRLEALVDVPAEPGAWVFPSGSGRSVVDRVVVRVEGGPAQEDDDEDGDGEQDAEPGEMVRVDPEGWRALRTVAPAEGETVLRWGTAGLRLDVRDEDGDPVDALVLAADEVYDAPEGRLELRGFDAGPLRLVVARRDVAGEGRELRLVLEAGKTRERIVVLPP